ncbi:Opr family porin [Arcobacter peruensis]|uniref:Opr family porin n=1 Tax=Arcobacter peruensis TaxID=2320140 RepID=UPI000F098585|nr:Opr family porin [Arcobacter peruensis]
MNKKISLVTCGLLLSTSMAFGADSIDEAFKSGSVSGSLTAYGQKKDNKGGTPDESNGYGTINLGYETASYKGFSAKAGFEAGHAMDDGALANDALMTEAYIKYANDMVSLTAGRQAIDLEWMGDYHEAVVAEITAIPDTSIVLGYSNQIAFADEDEITDFTGDLNGDGIKDDGAYVADIKYTGLEAIEFNPYYYSVPDIADWYGLKATYSSDMFGALAHYAASSEDVSTTNDGSLLALELSTSLSGVSVAAGYIATDDKGGIGSMALVGDNFEPLDNGDALYTQADAKMVYGSLGYTIAGVDLGVLYGETDFTANGEEKELNLSAGYSFTDSLSLGLLFVDYDLEGSSSSDYKDYSATLAYSF